MKTRKVATNGIQVHVAEHGEGPPVVLLHGLGWDHELWVPFMEQFTARYRIIAPDTRGHGRSDKPAGPYSIDAFAEDLQGLLNALALEKVALVGFSQGGMTAQLVALQQPKLVAALMLVCTACRSAPGVRDMLEERIRQARTAGPEAAARLAAKGIFSKGYAAAQFAAVERFVRWRAAMDQEALIAATRAAYGFDVSQRLHAIHAPSLIVYLSLIHI